MRCLLVAAALALASAQDDVVQPSPAPPAPSVPLPLGVPLVGAVGSGGIAYYTVSVPLPFSSLYFTVTPVYGNSDLYVNTAAAGQPTRSAYGWAAAGSTGSDGVTIYATDAAVRSACLRTARTGSVCQFSVGVYGGETASYVLSASVDASIKGLPAGMPMADSVTPNRYITYAYTASATSGPAAPVTIALSPYSGAAGLYIGSSRLNQTRPRGDVPISYCASSVPSADGSTSAIAYGTLTIGPGSPCWCDAAAAAAIGAPACVYYASVGGDNFASYSLVATEAGQAPVQLLDGLATRAAGAAGASALYDFVFVPAGVSSPGSIATVTLTQVGGEQDAVLYARMHRDGDTTMVPGPTTAHFTSRAVAGTAIISIPRNAPVFTDACGSANSTVPCRVHLAVLTPVAAAYAIQARTDVGQQLFDAIPVTGDARAGTISYFRFQHTAPLSPLVITVTTGTAPVEVYVSHSAQTAMFPPGPGEGKAGWKFLPSNPSLAMPVQTITVFPTDPGACVAPCTYVVGVLPSPAYTDPDAKVTFSVMARTRDVATVQLMDGRPTTDVVSSAGAFNYYSIVLPPTSAALVVTLSALSGSARAFGTFDGTLPGPDSAARGGFATAVDTAGGSDTTFVVSRFDDRVTRWCNNNVTRYEQRVITQTVMITEFRVTTAEELVNRVFIEPETGENVTVQVLRNVTKERPFTVPIQQNVTITVPQFDVTPLVCVLQIGVSSDVAGSSYGLTAATRARLLPDSMPLRVEVASGGEVQYFSYEAAAGAFRTTLSVTQMIGRVVVYVSTSNTAPNASTAQFMVGGMGASAITLDGSQPGVCDPSAVRCVFYLAVQAVGSTAAIATLQGSSFRVTPIKVAEQVAGRVGPSMGGSSPAYYTFTAPADATDMEVTVEPLSGGWLHVMVGGVADPATGAIMPPTAFCNAADGPTMGLAACAASDLVISNAAYAVQGLSSRTRVRLSAADGPDRYSPGKTYVLGVSSTLDSEYIVTLRPISPTASDVLLPSGVLLHDTLNAPDQVLYYTISMPTARLTGPGAVPIRIQASPVSGDVTMYLGVGNTPQARKPTAVAATAVAGFLEDYRFVLQPAYLAGLCPAGSPVCTITVGVQATSTSAYPVVFGIVASMGSGDTASIQLSAGVPQLGSVARGEYVYYHIPMAGVPRGVPLFVSLVEVNDGDADMYVSGDASLPTATNFQLTSPAFVAPEIIQVLPGSPAYVAALASGRLTIAIYGTPEGSTTDVAEFYLQVGTAGGVTELPDGATVEGSGVPGSFSYYSFAIPSAYTDVHASITPLSGAPQLTAAVWFKASDTTFNPAFRPGNPATPGSFTWKANFEGTLMVPKEDPAGCPGTCTYIYAVYCSGSITCQWEMSATSAMTVPVRVALGVPQMGYLPAQGYRFYVFDGGRAAKDFTVSAQATAGDITVLMSDSFIPGLTDVSRLPNVNDPTTYRAVSLEGTPLLQFSQTDLSSTSVVVGAVPQRSERIYVVAVYAPKGPVSYSLLVRQSTSVTVLPPGITSSMLPLAWKQSLAFDYDNQDPNSDLLISVTLLYGSVVVSATTSGAVPRCTVIGERVTGTANCTGAIWQAPNVGNSVQLRIAAKAPCVSSGSTTVLPGTCVPARDWKAALVSIVVSATDDALFQIVATTGADPLRAYDGTPIGLTQAFGDRPMVLLFQTSPDPQAAELHITMASSTTGASVDYYLTSCIDNVCTGADKLPGPANTKAWGQSPAGSRQEVVIKSTSPAYCSGTVKDICNYYLAVIPQQTYCRVNRISPCVAKLEVTFYSNSGGAPVLVDFATLNKRITTVQGLVRQPEYLGGPARYNNYVFYINRPGAPDDETIDIVTRLDACDSLRGFPVAYMCVMSPGPDRITCTNPRRPRPEEGGFNYGLVTAGTGIDRAFLLSEPSNELYVSVGLQPHPAGRTIATDEAMRKYGPSTFEYQVIDGPAVRMRLPFAGDNVLLAPTWVRVSSTVARVSWQPVVVTSDNAPFSDNVTAVGVTYRVYYAPDSFTAFASSITGASATDLGIVVTTPCGLERWAGIVNDNTQPIILPPGPNGGDNTQTLLINLVPGRRYRVAVVAVCDDDCLSANHLSMGMDRPEGPLSTQRLAYGQASITLVDPSPSASPSPAAGAGGHGAGAADGEPISPAMYGGGVMVALGFVGYVLFVAFRKRPEEDKLLAPRPVEGEDGAVEAAVNAGSEEVVMVTVNPDSHFLSSRRLERQASASNMATGASPAGSRSAGRPVDPASGATTAELQTLHRLTQRVYASQAVGGAQQAGAGAGGSASAGTAPQ